MGQSARTREPRRGDRNSVEEPNSVAAPQLFLGNAGLPRLTPWLLSDAAPQLARAPLGNSPTRALPRTSNLANKLLRRSGGLVTVRIPFGLVAQLVEQRPFKALVLGSSPSQPTKPSSQPIK